MLVLAGNVKQAQIVFRYILAMLESVPALAHLLSNQTLETISLSNGIDIEIRSAQLSRAAWRDVLRGDIDEMAYFVSDESSRNPADEIITAIKPALMTTGGLLVGIGSPHARKGPLWDVCKHDYGPNGDRVILVAKATSKEMNSTLPQAYIDREMEKDESTARSEYYAEFRQDIEDFLTIEAVDYVTMLDRLELLRCPASIILLLQTLPEGADRIA